MKRRDFVRTVGAGGALVGTAAAAASFPTPAIAQGIKQFKMVTTWPKNFPGLGTGAERLAQRITTMSEGKIEVKVFAAGELVPPFQSFDAVSAGNAEMSHSASYYWQGKSPGFNFFTAVPFGLLPMEHASWIAYGGGQELWDELAAPVRHQAVPARQHRPPDGRLVPPRDQHPRRLQGPQVPHAGARRRGAAPARHGGRQPARRRDLPGAAVGHDRRHRMGRPLARPRLRLLQGRPALLLARLARARHHRRGDDQSPGLGGPDRRRSRR